MHFFRPARILRESTGSLIRDHAPSILGVFAGVAALSAIWVVGLAINDSRPLGLKSVSESLTLLSAMAAVLASLWVHQRSKAFGESAALLANAIDLIEKTKKVLAPTGVVTNDRISWVTAARLLRRSEEIASRISTHTHQSLFEAEHDFQRHVLGEMLRDLHPSFFVGGTPGQTIGQAIDSQPHAKDGSNWIPARVLATVYAFADFPPEYEDPLDRSRAFSAEEMKRKALFNQESLLKYVYFLELFLPVGKRIMWRRTKTQPFVEASSTEIDSAIATARDRFLSE